MNANRLSMIVLLTLAVACVAIGQGHTTRVQSDPKKQKAGRVRGQLDLRRSGHR